MVFSIFSGILIYRMDHIMHLIDKVFVSDFREQYLEMSSENTNEMNYDELIVFNCMRDCYYGSGDPKWAIKHIRDSWDTIWASLLIGSFLGAYALGGSIYAYAGS